MNSPAVNEWEIEKSVLALFAEWLGSFFDGQAHVVGNVSKVFPQADLRFQQAALPQPLASSKGLALSTVWVKRGEARLTWDWVTPPTLPPNPPPAPSRQQVAYLNAGLLFFVRAQGPTRTGQDPIPGNSVALAMAASDLLFGLLQNSSTTNGLAQKGIHHTRAQNPVLVSSGTGSADFDLNYSTRMVSCQFQLRYAVISQPVS